MPALPFAVVLLVGVLTLGYLFTTAVLPTLVFAAVIVAAVTYTADCAWVRRHEPVHHVTRHVRVGYDRFSGWLGRVADERGARAVAWRVLGLLVGATLAVYVTPGPVTLGCLVLTCLWTLGRYGPPPPPWYRPVILQRAFVRSGILKESRVKATPRVRVENREDTDTGTGVTVKLPPGLGWSDVDKRHEQLAGALRLPASSLHIDQRPSDPANVVRLFVESRDPATTRSRIATVTTSPVTSWADDVPIGSDHRGDPVTLRTFEQNSLFGGIMGSGKTAAVRMLLAHFALDPATTMYGLDGKNSRSDYSMFAPLCERFLWGDDDRIVENTISMFESVLAEVDRRNNISDTITAPPGAPKFPGLLLLLEEYQDVRAAASKAQQDRLDNLLGRTTRKGRSACLHIVVSTQRPTVDDLPSSTRNLLSQRVALQTRNAADAAIILGEHPDPTTLPRTRGQALVAAPLLTRVTLDYITDDAWQALCARAAALRDVGTPPACAALTAAAETTVDPLLAAVVDALADAPDTGLPASELLTRLPTCIRSLNGAQTAQRLGTTLTRFPGHVESSKVAGRRVWRLTRAAQDAFYKASQEPSTSRPEAAQEPS